MLDRVVRGEVLGVTRDGAEVAVLRPRARRSPAPADLIARRRHLPGVDLGELCRAALEDENDGLEQARLGVESEPQLAMWPVVFVKRFDPERPIGYLDNVFSRHPVL